MQSANEAQRLMLTTKPCSRVFSTIRKQLTIEESDKLSGNEESMNDDSVYCYSRQSDCLSTRNDKIMGFDDEDNNNHGHQSTTADFCMGGRSLRNRTTELMNTFFIHSDPYDDFSCCFGRKVFTVVDFY
jgi:hypothetical protein